jgi:NAD(P)-dependent dehydrogenase (short-subunit alcohol dehydrogenase family)
VRSSARMTAIADLLAARGTAASILVNNAGVGKNGIDAQDVSDADWLWMMDVNLNGVFWCARAFGRHMLAAGKGAVVNIGSMSGSIANRPQPQTAYNVSKAAVHHLTRSLAGEWAAQGVRVNAVAPTYIETPLVTAIAASVVLFLASEAASLMTGAIVAVDGGFTVW